MQKLDLDNTYDRIYAQYLGFLSCRSINPPDITVPVSWTIPKAETLDKEFLRTATLPAYDTLGKRMEWFFKNHVEIQPNWGLVASNLQIIKSGQTLGELDYILKHHVTNKLIHLELACKLYLYDPETDGDETKCWIGPNRTDNLQLKIDKLNNHQLPLLYHPQTQLLLSERQIDVKNIDKQTCCLIGDCYVPLELYLQNKEVYSGWWMKWDEFEKENRNSTYGFFLPEKQDWFVNPAYNGKWKSFNEVMPDIKESIGRNQSSLIWLKTEVSYKRFFVVWW